MNLLPYRTLLMGKISEQNVFLVNMPETVTRGVLITHSVGGARLDANLPDYKIANIQLIVRDVNYQDGYAFAREVMQALSVLETDVDGVLIKYVNPLHDPLLFPQTKGGLTEFSLNFKTAYVEH